MPDLRRVTLWEVADAKEMHERILRSAEYAAFAIRSAEDDPMMFLQRLRFEKMGRCPITEKELNIVEQLNQTFTILAQIRSTETLLKLHPEAGGFKLALGTCPGYDIMSVNPGIVVAEAFSATSHTSNRKLAKEIARLNLVTNFKHKYVFFSSPGYPLGRNCDLETCDKVQVFVTAI